LLWVFVAFFWSAVVVAAGPLYPLFPDAYTWLLSTSIVIPIVLGYAILRHRVFDITFTVNRAIVYAIMTAALALVIGLLDWVVERFIGSRNFALAVEALAAVIFGIGFDKVRRVLEGFIEQALFRERHAAERTVRRIVASLAFADSYEAIGVANVDDVGRAMKLASAALFLRQENSVYRRVHSYGWQKMHRAILTTGDSILRVMHTELAPIRLVELPWDCEGPDGFAAPSIAIPLVARNELLGLLLYGMHDNGLSIDPPEVELLAQVGRASASALDNVDARATRRALVRARRELAALGASVPQLSELPSKR
jgi:hypothetical protein